VCKNLHNIAFCQSCLHKLAIFGTEICVIFEFSVIFHCTYPVENWIHRQIILCRFQVNIHFALRRSSEQRGSDRSILFGQTKKGKVHTPGCYRMYKNFCLFTNNTEIQNSAIWGQQSDSNHGYSEFKLSKMAALAWTKARRGRYTEVFSNQTHTRKWNLELALSVAFVKVVGMTASKGGLCKPPARLEIIWTSR